MVEGLFRVYLGLGDFGVVSKSCGLLGFSLTTPNTSNYGGGPSWWPNRSPGWRLGRHSIRSSTCSIGSRSSRTAVANSCASFRVYQAGVLPLHPPPAPNASTSAWPTATDRECWWQQWLATLAAYPAVRGAIISFEACFKRWSWHRLR